MDSFLLLKLAYEQEAAVLEKDAAPIPLLGAIGRGFSNFGKWLVPKFQGIAKTVGESTQAAENLGKGVAKAERGSEATIGAAATKPTKEIAKTVTEEATKKPSLLKNIGSLTGLGDTPKGTWGYTLGAPLRPFFGGEGAGNVVGFGIMGGGINAALAEPGERLEAFGKGFGSGLAGGAGWQWGGSLGKGMLGRLAKPGAAGFRGNIAKVTNPNSGLNTYSKIMQYGKGNLPSLLGAKTVAGTVGLGTALGSSMALQTASEKYVPFLKPNEGSMTLPPGVQAGANVAGKMLDSTGMGLTAPQMGGFNQAGANPYGTI